jgi:hypothetical protein
MNPETFDKQRCHEAVHEYIRSKKASRACAGKAKDAGGPRVAGVREKEGDSGCRAVGTRAEKGRDSTWRSPQPPPP